MLLAAACLLFARPGSSAELLVYAGTDTNHGGKGIYLYRFQTTTGKLTAEGIAVETPNPTFLLESRRVVYAVNETAGDAHGTVSAFGINPKNGKLVMLNRVSSRGGAPCHLALDTTGKWLAAANCGGSLAVFPVQPDGRLGEAAAFEQQPAKSRVTGVAFSPDNRFLVAADEGLDRILVYRFDAEKGSLAAGDPPFTEVKAGSGVRRVAFHPGGKALYALAGKASTVTAFHWDAEKGSMEEFQSVLTWPMGFSGTSEALELLMNREGSVLYVSNKGLDGLAQFAVDPERLALTAIDFPPAMGHNPRGVAIDPTGHFLFVANQDSGSLAVFRMHPRTGQLQPGATAGMHVPALTSVVFVPAK